MAVESMRIGRARATGDTSPAISERNSEAWLPPEAPEASTHGKPAPLRSRAVSTIADHTFDLCIISPIPERFRAPSIGELTQEECLQAIMYDEDDAAEWEARWHALFQADCEPVEQGPHLRGKLKPAAETYTQAEGQMYAGLWIERRARELGMHVRATPSRDRDEVLRQIDVSVSRMEEILTAYPELANELPSMRDVEKAHSHLFSYKYDHATSTVHVCRFSSLERIHLLMHILTSDVGPSTHGDGQGGNGGGADELERGQVRDASGVSCSSSGGSTDAAVSSGGGVGGFRGAGLRLHEYEERGMMRVVPIHDGRARLRLWQWYFWSDWMAWLGPFGWIGWFMPTLRAALMGLQPLLCCRGSDSTVATVLDRWADALANKSNESVSRDRSATISMLRGAGGQARMQADPAMARLDQMRNYFGEKVALYFAFLECFTNSLLPLAVLGTPVSVAGWIRYGTPDNPLVLWYSIISLLWITFFCQYWQRQEARLAYRWGTETFEDEEKPRRQFLRQVRDDDMGFYTKEGWFVSKRQLRGFLNESGGGDLMREECPLAREDVQDLVDHYKWTTTKTFTVEQRWVWQALSVSAIGVLTVTCAVGAVSILTAGTLMQVGFHLRGLPNFIDYAWLRPYHLSVGRLIGTICASVWIGISNGLLSTVARLLTDRELHRTETEYEDAYILKVCIFQFVNSFLSLFYVAFEAVEPPVPDT